MHACKKNNNHTRKWLSEKYEILGPDPFFNEILLNRSLSDDRNVKKVLGTFQVGLFFALGQFFRYKKEIMQNLLAFF
jgi:hypothetical protein